jgi:hypothetical protein
MRYMRSQNRLCVVTSGVFLVVEGPCKRYAMAHGHGHGHGIFILATARHVCQATTASRGRRRSVSPEADRMTETVTAFGAHRCDSVCQLELEVVLRGPSLTQNKPPSCRFFFDKYSVGRTRPGRSSPTVRPWSQVEA